MIEHADVIILCLPTPVKKNLTPDLSYITFTLKNIQKYFKHGQILILKVQLITGSTKKIILPYLKILQLAKTFFFSLFART